MRKLTCLLTALFLAACGADEPPAPADEPVVDEQAVEAPAEPDAATDAADEAIQVVEESAAEPASDEQTILLAQADVPAASRTWKYSEGQHYDRMVPTQPTVGGADKVEVSEFFWYGCPHCNDVEPYVNRWLETKPASVRFVRIPAMWNGILKLHARLYYTQEVLARNGVIKDGPGFHAAVFQEYHTRGNRLSTESAIQRLFERFGVSPEEFEKTWNSFEVAQKLRVAEDLARRYSIASVPAFVVNGKFKTGGQQAGSYPRLFEIIDELIARENAR
ncbi:MAG: thiol:disulfide interchange protein DsbA/DsbL [Woeseiaceae bacterium]|nr:thiol:disulfide interchange protein DsbA/DsbL [Woeseiaceae bacterium]